MSETRGSLISSSVTERGGTFFKDTPLYSNPRNLSVEKFLKMKLGLGGLGG